ncbi:aminoglycoside 3-N-acetyltransferase [Paenibacillus methanolicus]|uniref:Aminoglycoside N(3)-acetyltransferase n=1 Tax=Paenibacillus methanolicus TaxID=582686 RepID=A0A5S5CI37_9BACL|nr:aminoglycoside 3-N-acetyltransferase [Paenibacillus methanolicus]
MLLIGVGYDKATSLHLAETRADFPSKHEVEDSSAILVGGRRTWVTYRTQHVDDSDFVQLGAEYEQAHGITPHRIGDAQVRLLAQPPLVDWAAAWMERNRGNGAV